MDQIKKKVYYFNRFYNILKGRKNMQKNKRKEFINKFIADFLVIVFLLVSIPMETFADEINKI